MKEMTCQVCGKKFFCNCDEECSPDATLCYCKECSIKKWGTKFTEDIGSLELCYGGIPEKEKVLFT